jgi:hypothetical protein
MKYYVWIKETEKGEPVEVGHGPYTLEKAKQFARIGSQYGGPRHVTRGVDGGKVRTYRKGKRTFPTVTKQLTGLTKEEVPKSLEDSGMVENPKSAWIWTAAGVGAAVAALAALVKGAVSPPIRQAGRVQIRDGVATGPTGYAFRFQPADRIWLARTLIGEVAEADSDWESLEVQRGGAAVLWALLQLYLLRSNSDGTVPLRAYPTFISFVRNYAQPINPAWAVAGQGKCAQHPDRCTPRNIARRARITNATWDQIPTRAVQLLDDWIAGRVDNPIPGLVDYAHYHFPGEQVNIANNNFGIVAGRRLV